MVTYGQGGGRTFGAGIGGRVRGREQNRDPHHGDPLNPLNYGSFSGQQMGYRPVSGQDWSFGAGVGGRVRGREQNRDPHHGDPLNPLNYESFSGQQMGYRPVSGQDWDWSFGHVAAPYQCQSSEPGGLISGHPSWNQDQFAEPTIPASAWVGSAWLSSSFNQGPALYQVQYLEPRNRISRNDHSLMQVPFSSRGKFAEPTMPASPWVGSAWENTGGNCREGDWKTNYASGDSRNSGSVSGLSGSSKWEYGVEIPDEVDQLDEEANSFMWGEHDNVLMDNHMNEDDDEFGKLLTKVEDVIGNLYITFEKMGSLVGQLVEAIAAIFIFLAANQSKDLQTA